MCARSRKSQANWKSKSPRRSLSAPSSMRSKRATPRSVAPSAITPPSSAARSCVSSPAKKIYPTSRQTRRYPTLSSPERNRSSSSAQSPAANLEFVAMNWLHFDERSGEAEAAGAHRGFERGNHFGIEARDGERTNAVHREIEVHRRLVRAVRGDGVERIGHRYDSRHLRN